jgi:hypothetical protein
MHFRGLDQALSGLIDGAGGGTYAPASPIVVVGAAASLSGGTGSSLTGEVRVRAGGGLNAPGTSIPARTRTVRFNLAGAIDQGAAWDIGRTAIQARVGNAGIIVGAGEPWRFHRGANLLRARMYWRVTVPRQALPASQPSFNLYSRNMAGGGLSIFNVGASFGTVATYFDSGVKLLEWVNPGTTILSLADTAYRFEILGEGGAGAGVGTEILALEATFSQITSFRTE